MKSHREKGQEGVLEVRQGINRHRVDIQKIGSVSIESRSGKSMVQPQTVKQILQRYATLLQNCRDRIITDLENAPGTAVLTDYFQKGKQFRALVAFVAASAIGD